MPSGRPSITDQAVDGFRSLPLHPLDDADACALLERLGVPACDAARLNRIARGGRD